MFALAGLTRGTLEHRRQTQMVFFRFSADSGTLWLRHFLQKTRLHRGQPVSLLKKPKVFAQVLHDDMTNNINFALEILKTI